MVNYLKALTRVMATCDIIVATTGVSKFIKPEMTRPGQIILALSNPNPEITPEDALAAGAAFAADGRFRYIPWSFKYRGK